MVIRFSTRLGLLLLLFHITVAAVVNATEISVAVKVALIIMIVLNLIYYLARDVLLNLPDSWCEVSLDQDIVAIVTRDGSKLLGQVSKKSMASSFFVVIRVRLEGRHLTPSRVIFPDMVGVEGFRQLRVQLKFA